jgi:hypothetical protein
MPKAPIATITVPQLRFNWGEAAPAAGLKAGRFAMVATASAQLPPGQYELTTVSDDGVRVYLNDKLVLNNFTNHEPAEEDRGEEQEQGQLDGLALGVGDDRHDETDPERGEKEQRDRRRERDRVAEERDPEPDDEQGDGQCRDQPPDEQVGEDLPDDDLAGLDRRDPEEIDDAVVRLCTSERARDREVPEAARGPGRTRGPAALWARRCVMRSWSAPRPPAAGFAAASGRPARPVLFDGRVMTACMTALANCETIRVVGAMVDNVNDLDD